LNGFGLRFSAAATAVRYLLVSFIAVLISAQSGCSMGGGGPPPPGGQLKIESVAKWYQTYKAFNNGKGPPNEQAFLAFIESRLKERGEAVPSDLLISPVDGKKYVINYGKPTSPSMDKNVAVYESEGYNGKKWVGFESAYGREVDDNELKALLAGK
jgi:hypothetical protein